MYKELMLDDLIRRYFYFQQYSSETYSSFSCSEQISQKTIYKKIGYTFNDTPVKLKQFSIFITISRMLRYRAVSPLWFHLRMLTVLDLVSQVRNVVLMNVYFDLGNSRGMGGIWAKGGKWKVSLRATWIQGGRILSQQGGFQVSRNGLERGAKGNQQGETKSRGNAPCLL